MAERIADNADLAVDELKRKARRRLIGAIVLALAAAVILPLLLEKEQKPLGDDVSVQIPPVDEGKFINRLTGRPGDAKSGVKFGMKAESRPEAPRAETMPAAVPAPDAGSAPAANVRGPFASATTSTSVATAAPTATMRAPKKSVSEAEQRVLSPGAKTALQVRCETGARFRCGSCCGCRSDSGGDGRREACGARRRCRALGRSGAGGCVPRIRASIAPAPVATPAKPEGFAVQIAAFTDDKGANALAAKLKKAGYASTYTEPVETSRGTLWRVRVGGFASRPDADAARVKLKADGWSGLVVAAK